MASAPDSFSIPPIFEMDIRVRYQETDGQGRVHHTNYINYFEVARVEMLRASGKTYRDLEEEGIMLVVAKVECEYQKAAKDDDLLRIKATVEKAKGVRIVHRYEITLDDEIVCTGRTVVAAINREGAVVRLPSWLRLKS
jgi:acyl-CoA thioester hydrolase